MNSGDQVKCSSCPGWHAEGRGCPSQPSVRALRSNIQLLEAEIARIQATCRHERMVYVPGFEPFKRWCAVCERPETAAFSETAALRGSGETTAQAV